MGFSGQVCAAGRRGGVLCEKYAQVKWGTVYQISLPVVIYHGLNMTKKSLKKHLTELLLKTMATSGKR